MSELLYNMDKLNKVDTGLNQNYNSMFDYTGMSTPVASPIPSPTMPAVNMDNIGINNIDSIFKPVPFSEISSSPGFGTSMANYNYNNGSQGFGNSLKSLGYTEPKQNFWDTKAGYGMMGLQAASTLGNAYLGYKNYKLQKDAYGHQKAMDLANLSNYMQDYNSKYSERINRMNYSPEQKEQMIRDNTLSSSLVG